MLSTPQNKILFPDTIISKAGDCSIRKFMSAWFDEKYKVLIIEGEHDEALLKQAFELIHAEYTDLAELFLSAEFEKMTYIYYLNNRISTIKYTIGLQKDFIRDFGLPYIPALPFFKKFGHSIYWDTTTSNVPAFLKILDQIEVKEKKYEAQLKAKEKELGDLQARKTSKEFTPLQTRHAFIKTLNGLQKAGYRIDKESTTVEEFGLMIKEQKKENERIAAEAKNRK